MGQTVIRIIRNFMWNNPRIALDTLYHPVDEGGLNLLDPTSRNETIERRRPKRN
jgi:hypothetical protein